MESKAMLKHIAIFTCVYYTATTFFILLLYFILNNDLTNGVHPLALVCFLPFSLAFSCANTIYTKTALSLFPRLSLHYLLTVGGAMLFLYLPNKVADQKATAGLLLWLVLTVVYALIMGVILGVKSRIKRVEREAAPYQDVYKKK